MKNEKKRILLWLSFCLLFCAFLSQEVSVSVSVQSWMSGWLVDRLAEWLTDLHHICCGVLTDGDCQRGRDGS